MTANERLEQWATRMGTTVDAIKAHAVKTQANEQALWQAKQDGATDEELIALAIGETT